MYDDANALSSFSSYDKLLLQIFEIQFANSYWTLENSK